jgi:hypothetical protein
VRAPEIAHYSELLADLHVAAARATSVEQRAVVREQTRQAYLDIFSLLSHDTARAFEVLHEAEIIDEINLGQAAPSLRSEAVRT